MNGASRVIGAGMIKFDVDRRPNRIVAGIEVHEGRFHVHMMNEAVPVEDMDHRSAYNREPIRIKVPVVLGDSNVRDWHRWICASDVPQ